MLKIFVKLFCTALPPLYRNLLVVDDFVSKHFIDLDKLPCIIFILFSTNSRMVQLDNSAAKKKGLARLGPECSVEPVQYEALQLQRNIDSIRISFQ
jgi:hypothetical protein